MIITGKRGRVSVSNVWSIAYEYIKKKGSNGCESNRVCHVEVI